MNAESLHPVKPFRPVSAAALRAPSAVLALALAAGCAAPADNGVEPRQVTRGPLPTRIVLPQALVFPEPRPRSVMVQTPGTLSGAAVLSYASIYEFARVPPDTVHLDAEVAHLGLIARYGLTSRTDIEVELPVSFATSGFLDSLVDTFHDLFQLPGGDRGSRGRDLYELSIAYDDQVVWERQEDELELMDVPIHLTRVLRRPAGGLTGVALRFGVELPTGDEARGTGSGGTDWDVGVLLERTSGRWTWTGGVDYVGIDVPSAYRAAGVAPNDLWLATLGLEYRLSDRSSCVAGLRYRSPFTDDFDIKEIDLAVLDVSFGYVRDIGARGNWFAALHEDAIAESGPDVTLSLGYQFGR